PLLLRHRSRPHCCHKPPATPSLGNQVKQYQSVSCSFLHYVIECLISLLINVTWCVVRIACFVVPRITHHALRTTLQCECIATPPSSTSLKVRTEPCHVRARAWAWASAAAAMRPPPIGVCSISLCTKYALSARTHSSLS